MIFRLSVGLMKCRFYK